MDGQGEKELHKRCDVSKGAKYEERTGIDRGR